MFNQRDIQEINRMPTSCTSSADKAIWKWSRNGLFSVKSAYYGIMEQIIDNSHLKVDGDWKSVWCLKIPPKVKLLVWRALRGVLPTRCRLQTKGVQCVTSCPFCEHGKENEWYAFIGCNNAMKCWEVVGLSQLIQNLVSSATGFTDLIFRMLAALSTKQKHEIAMVLWCLWKRRNDKIWKEEDKEVVVSVALSRQALRDWETARLHHSSSRAA